MPFSSLMFLASDARAGSRAAASGASLALSALPLPVPLVLLAAGFAGPFLTKDTALPSAGE